MKTSVWQKAKAMEISADLWMLWLGKELTLSAGYLHRIGRRDSAAYPHCNDADETAEHLVLQCPAHDQDRWDIWPGGKLNTDPRRLWDFLEQIRVVTRPLTGNERERE